MKKEEEIGRILKEKGLTIACAESMTGGLISAKITDVAGASRYFKGSIVCYSIESKVKLLFVPLELIEEHGVVSKEVAEKMAEGVRRVMGVDIGLSITGFAGPEGGSRENPVGTVYIGLSTQAKGIVKSLKFEGDRERIRQKATEAALDFLFSFLSDL